MREMKDSGVEWIGEIPSTWKEFTIGALFNVRNEKVNDTDYPPLSVSRGGIVPQMENVAKTDANDNRKMVLKCDFAINSRSDRKQSCGVAPMDGSVSLINTVLYKSIQAPIVSEYPNYLMKNYGFAEEFYRWGHGIVADLWTTRWQEMKSILLPLPSVTEQEAIIEAIQEKASQIDSLIANQEAQIEKLKAYKQSLITEVVTKGLDPSVPLKDSGVEWIGEIPEHWNIVPMKNVFDFSKGLPITKADLVLDGIQVVSYGQIHSKQNTGTHLDSCLVRYVSNDYLDTNIASLTGYNSELGDKPFSEKKDLLSDAHSKVVTLYEDVKDKMAWNAGTIRDRAKRLSSILVQMYKVEMPSVSVSFNDPSYAEYTCENPENATFKYPKYFVIQGEQVNCKTFADMLKLTVRQLYSINASVIENMARNNEKLYAFETPFFSYDKDKVKDASPIKNTAIYHSTGFSASSIIWIIRALLEKYDIEYSDFIYCAKSNSSGSDKDTEDNSEASDSDNDILRLQYWTGALPVIISAFGGNGSFSNVSPTKGSTINGFIGIAGINLYCTARILKHTVSANIWIDVVDKEKNKLIFDLMYRHKEEVESILDYPVSWNRNDGNRSSTVCVIMSDVDFENKEKWNEQYLFLAKSLVVMKEKLITACETEIRAVIGK